MGEKHIINFVIMKIEVKKISDLKPASYNPRKSSPAQDENLKRSLEKFGVVEPIVFNEQTGNIVGGHFRIRELKKLGYKEIECVIVDLSLEDEKELNIRLNANTGEFDWELLKSWDAKELGDWGMDDFNLDENKIMLTKKPETKILKPYQLTHVLISFPPERLIDIQNYLEAIKNNEFVEYEQSSN